MIRVSIKVSGKKQFAENISTYNVDSQVKKSAEKRNDKKMTMVYKGKINWQDNLKHMRNVTGTIPAFYMKKKQKDQIYDKAHCVVLQSNNSV